MNDEQIQTRKKHQRFYQCKEWKRLKLFKLATDPCCEICLKKGLTTPALAVDHITPLAIDWSLRLTLDNLQSLCLSCHSRKTAGEEKIMKRNAVIERTHEELEQF